MQEDNDQRRRHHVRLPGGRQIEVVYLDSRREHHVEVASAPQASSDTPVAPRASSDTPVAPRASSDTPVAPTPWSEDSPRTAPGEALHVCPRCAGGLVHPLDWAEQSPGRWRINMRCPDCGMRREGVFGQALVERLDEELDRATGSLLSDLKQLTHANMAEEIELFARALQLDLIDPSDF